MNQKPTSVTVLSIIGLVLGAIGVLGLAWTGISVFVGFGRPNPLLDSLYKDQTYLIVIGLGLAIGLPLFVLMVASCIGSLNLKPWARKGMLIYAWVAIVQAIWGTIFNMAYVFPKMIAGLPASTPSPVRVGLEVGQYSAGCGTILGLIFPVCVLYFFTRPKVIDAFNGIFPATPAAPTNFPVEFPQSNPS